MFFWKILRRVRSWNLKKRTRAVLGYIFLKLFLYIQDILGQQIEKYLRNFKKFVDLILYGGFSFPGRVWKGFLGKNLGILLKGNTDFIYLQNFLVKR